MRTGDPDVWQDSVDAAGIARENHDAIALRERAAGKAEVPVQ